MTASDENGAWSRALTRRQLVRRAGVATAALGVGSLGAGGFVESALAAIPRRGGTITMALNAANESYDPLNPALQIDSFVLYNVYRALTKYDHTAKRYVPDMARDFSMSRDGRTWKFALHKGILFHDMKELTSADVKFSLDQWVNPKNNSIVASLLPAGVSAHVLDRYTIRFTSPQPSVQLLAALSRDGGAIFPARAFKNRVQHPIGTGPFKFASYVKGQRTVLERFEHFWEGAPYLDKVEFVPIPDGSARVAALLSGQVQLIDETPFEQIASVKKNHKVDMLVFPSTMVDGVLFNCTRAPFNNVSARQAVAHALDRTQINKAATFGFGTINPTFVPANFPFAPQVHPLATDLNAAASLANQSGLKGQTIEILSSSAAFPPWGRACDYIAAVLAQIGVTVKVTDLDLGTYVQRIFTTKDYDLAYIGVIGSPEADQRTVPFFQAKSSLNWTGYNGGPKFENLLTAQRAAVTNPAQRQNLLNEIWQQITNDVPWYFTYAWPGAQGLSPKIRNFHADPEDFPFFDKVWLAT